MSLNLANLTQYISDNFGMNINQIDEHSNLVSSGILDSFNVIELVSFIEKEANIKFGVLDLNMDNLDSVSSILAYVDRKKSA